MNISFTNFSFTHDPRSYFQKTLTAQCSLVGNWNQAGAPHPLHPRPSPPFVSLLTHPWCKIVAFKKLYQSNALSGNPFLHAASPFPLASSWWLFFLLALPLPPCHHCLNLYHPVPVFYCPAVSSLVLPPCFPLASHCSLVCLRQNKHLLDLWSGVWEGQVKRPILVWVPDKCVRPCVNTMHLYSH